MDKTTKGFLIILFGYLLGIIVAFLFMFMLGKPGILVGPIVGGLILHISIKIYERYWKK